MPLVKKVADKIVSEETEILKELIPRMFEVMHSVARLSCDYVKRSKFWLSVGLAGADDRSENDRWSHIHGDD